MKKIFLFDLDSTLTKQEILPTIAEEIGKSDEMRALTEGTMMGEIPFRESFISRVNILKNISIKNVSQRISEIEVSERLMDFMRRNIDSCYVVTSNLDVWIHDLIKKNKLSDNVFCSEAIVKDDKIVRIRKILAKEDVIKNFQDFQVIAIGDGSNDYELLKHANIAIAYGGVRHIAPRLYDVADYAVCKEEKLCWLLTKILEDDND